MRKFKSIMIVTLGMSLFGCSGSPEDIVPEINNPELSKDLIRQFDANQDHKLMDYEVKQIKKLNLGYGFDDYKNFESLKLLTSLEELSGNGTEAVVLDLKGIKSLKRIDFMNVKELKTITVPENLQSLGLERARALESIELPDMPFLASLYLLESPINKLTIGHCPSLTTLTIKRTNISEIDLTKFPRLESFDCNYSEIKTLDVSSLKHLRSLRCKGVKTLVMRKDQRIEEINIEEDYRYGRDQDLTINYIN